MPIRRLTILAAALLAAGATHARTIESSDARATLEVVADGLANPWGLAFLPDGAMLVTEKGGAVRIVASDGTVGAPLPGAPNSEVRGQGGLLDVALDPSFADSGLVYFTFAEPGPGGVGTAVARAVLERDGATGGRLAGTETIFSMNEKTNRGQHFGSRLAFARDGTLLFTIGDRGRPDDAQNPRHHAGSVLRIEPDGAIPADNPSPDGAAMLPEIWSIGHRNPQSAAIDPLTGRLWVVEHGPRGGDEINIPEKGLNYGWPEITYGREYSGGPVGEGISEKPGLEQPLYYWVPSIAPSGMAFYTGDAFPGWRGDLFVGALRGQMLVRLDRDGERILGEERLLTDLGERIRDVRQGPDGALYLVTDGANGRILRLAPAD